MARVLALEPYYGGSHRAFIDGLIAHSAHRFALLSQPAYFWKWRMRGAAITLAQQVRELDFSPDLILASDMLSLAEFKAIHRAAVPTILYMHESQLSYPASDPDPRDVHFGFTNLSSILAADAVVWNSNHHLTAFLEALPRFIAAMPDHHPRRLAETIRAKSLVIHPGVELDDLIRLPLERDGGPPIILWNHRWEFDQRPELFFAAIDELDRQHLLFRLAILGENFQNQPQVFLEAQDRYADRIVRFGFVDDRRDYGRWLRRSSLSVSVADQENFGIAAVEAAVAGAAPLWPDRLSYPELVEPRNGREHLYSAFPELVLKLKKALTDAAYLELLRVRCELSPRRFSWPAIIGRYDDLIERIAATT